MQINSEKKLTEEAVKKLYQIVQEKMKNAVSSLEAIDRRRLVEINDDEDEENLNVLYNEEEKGSEN